MTLNKISPSIIKIYASPYSQIVLERNKNLLVVSWLRDSQSLSIAGVKSEISKIRDCMESHFIENIIIETSHYSFADNPQIQNWINYSFMPVIMDSPVKKYGIVIKSPVGNYENYSTDGSDYELQVEYFNNLNDAKKWIES